MESGGAGWLGGYSMVESGGTGSTGTLWWSGGAGCVSTLWWRVVALGVQVLYGGVVVESGGAGWLGGYSMVESGGTGCTGTLWWSGGAGCVSTLWWRVVALGAWVLCAEWLHCLCGFSGRESWCWV